MKTNARKEFLEFIAETEATVLWVKFVVMGREYRLPEEESSCKEDWDAFLDGLDFKYYSGYGGDDTSGAIMFSDGSWAEREEYDGASYWAMRIKPTY
jgi:hypothetical protein